jgi:hypothetical protein
MLTEEQLRGLPPKAAEFWRMAQSLIKTNQTEWQWIAPGTDQFAAWVKYFQSKGWEPFGFRQIRKGLISGMIVPTEYPEWFDKQYSGASMEH